VDRLPPCTDNELTVLAEKTVAQKKNFC
jgi:hypothetical protein